MPRFSPRATFVALLAALASCSTLGPDLVAPELSLLGIQIMSADMFAQQFTVRVKVENPNDLEVAVSGLEYEIFLMGDSFAEGAADSSFVNFVSSLGRLVSRTGGGKLENVPYQVTGKLMLEKGVMRTIPFSHAGTVDFTKAKEKMKAIEPKP